MLDNSYTKHWDGYSEIIFSTTVEKITLSRLLLQILSKKPTLLFKVISV